MRILYTAAALLAPALAFASPGFGGGRAEQAMSQLNDKFTAADKDHDGKLTREEASAGMPRLASRFDEIDSEHRGYLTLEQIQSYMQARAGG